MVRSKGVSLHGPHSNCQRYLRQYQGLRRDLYQWSESSITQVSDFISAFIMEQPGVRLVSYAAPLGVVGASFDAQVAFIAMHNYLQ